MIPLDYTHPVKIKHRDMLLSKCLTAGVKKRVLTLGGPHLQDIVQWQQIDTKGNKYTSYERNKKVYTRQHKELRKLEKSGAIRMRSVELMYGSIADHFTRHYDVYYIDTCNQWCREKERMIVRLFKNSIDIGTTIGITFMTAREPRGMQGTLAFSLAGSRHTFLTNRVTYASYAISKIAANNNHVLSLLNRDCATYQTGVPMCTLIFRKEQS